ncbi:MAG: hypothetical protein KAW67_02440 [Candidatus Eisenbacteria sp.]|nr:hypothetical protein [Candidatus Eisenbacteria bacterium]
MASLSRESLSWTSWPMLRSPVRAVLAVAFVVLMAWTIQSMFRTTYFTVVAVLLVWGQVAGFFLPTRFSLTDERVSVRGLVSRREKDWSEFRSHYVDREGVLLSPFVERSRLERFRGVSLQFHGNRDEVVAFVEHMMARGDDTGDGAEGGVTDEPVKRLGDEGQGGRASAA